LDKVLAAFPDGRELFELFPNAYIDTLDGVEYAHAYHGDNMMSDWLSFEDASWEGSKDFPIERQHEFWKWMRDNQSARWEVWT
jgi:hypothetical protein